MANSLDGYIQSRFVNGIDPYIDVLKKHNIIDKTYILDVGCGPGCWAFAAAKLNTNALVTGIDVNEYLLNFAVKYQRKNEINNVLLLKLSYEELPSIFHPKSFDVIMLNSVVQFINEKKALSILSSLLKDHGVILMFYNTDRGYYLQNLIIHLKKASIKHSLYNLFILCDLSRLIRGRTLEHCVTFKQLKIMSKNEDIILEKIKTEPKLDYKDDFLGLTCIYSCKGTKFQRK